MWQGAVGLWCEPEQLVSRFHVSHGMLLNVLSRRGDGCGAMRQLVRDSHEPEGARAAHRKRAWQLFRALLARQIVEFVPPDEHGTTLRVNVDLQDDFSMDQALSLYLIETIPLLDPESETHALELLTLVESILENPELILRRQLDKLKSELEIRGTTLIPLAIYFKDGRVKAEVALAKGKKAHDKRATVREREAKKEVARAMKHYKR